MTVNILIGDCREVLTTLPEKSVQCVVTSPPYFGLRSYDGGDAEIGREPTPDEFVAALVEVFRGVRRVLRDDGTVWLNLGSSFASKRVESTQWTIKRDLDFDSRVAVAKAMSSVWSGYASSKQAMQNLLGSGASETRELSESYLPKVQDNVCCPQDSVVPRKREILLQELCEVGEPHEEEAASRPSMQSMLGEDREISCGYAQEQREDWLLQQRMLVQIQPTGQPLSLVGRSGREDEPRRSGVEERSPDSGQVSLPPLQVEQEIGGSPHTSVQESQGRTMGFEQRPDTMSGVSPENRKERTGSCAATFDYSFSSTGYLAGLAFDKRLIPAEFLQWCEPEHVIKPKDDMQIPARVAFALQADGWFLRSEIIWAKPSPMPESVTDRPTKAHEQVFLLTKRPTYFYDAERIREDVKPNSGIINGAPLRGKHVPTEGGRRTERREYDVVKGANRRTVWTIASQPFSGAHFATMPPELAETCIKAGTSERGQCPHCGAPWVRQVERTAIKSDFKGSRFDAGKTGHRDGGDRTQSGDRFTTEHVGWLPSCTCPAHEPAPQTVLDPFGGAGTTALAADRLQRNATIIELNPAYAAIARARINGEAGLFSPVAAE